MNDYQIIKKEYLKFLKKNEVGKSIVDKIGKFNNFYLPLSEWIYSIYKKKKETKIIGLSGGQGAGKSTITKILKFILKKKYRVELCVFSLDDFYKTKLERLKMSKKVHPLFLTRGVPGTHDISLINKTIKSLKKQRSFRKVYIPKFDKSTDNRAKKSKWMTVKTPPDIIILEGWCVGSKHQENKKLKKPINFLEKKFDPKLKWRKRVNDELKKDYKKLFSKVDKLVYLKAPTFKHIFKWRLLQEQKLKLTSKGNKIMSKSEIKKFIMFYERITRHMMRNFLEISDLTIFLDKNHRSKKMKFLK